MLKIITLTQHSVFHAQDIDLLFSVISEDDGVTPLHQAIRDGQFNHVQTLIRAGADIHIQDKQWGSTPLHDAANEGHLNIVQELLKAGARPNPELPEAWDTTPLHEATANGYLAIVKELVKEGAKVDATDNVGFTPLLFAAMNNHLQVLIYLVEEAHANLSLTDPMDRTALTLAKRRGHDDIVNYLTTKQKKPHCYPYQTQCCTII